MTLKYYIFPGIAASFDCLCTLVEASPQQAKSGTVQQLLLPPCPWPWQWWLGNKGEWASLRSCALHSICMSAAHCLLGQFPKHLCLWQQSHTWVANPSARTSPQAALKNTFLEYINGVLTHMVDIKCFERWYDLSTTDLLTSSCKQCKCMITYMLVHIGCTKKSRVS